MEKSKGLEPFCAECGCAGVVLAAGRSSRMGRPKMLLPLRGQTLLGRVLGAALESRLNPVVLVVGYEAERILDSLGGVKSHRKLRIVENRDFADGMSTSLVCGLREVEKECGAVMVLLGDMPFVSAGLVDHLLKRTAESGLPLGAVVVRGRRSLPVVIRRELYDEVKELTGDAGARGLFSSHPDRVCLVEPPEDYDDTDIDTPEDFERLRRAVDKTPPS